MTTEVQNMIPMDIDRNPITPYIDNKDKMKKKFFKNHGLPLEFISKIGGLPPLMPLNPYSRPEKTTVSSKWIQKTCKIRKDNLTVRKWERTDQKIFPKKGEVEDNIENFILSYSNNDWDTYIQEIDSCWSKEETDYLWDLVKLFEMRFVVIHDRYDTKFNRSLEEIKNRFYSVSLEIIKNRGLLEHPLTKTKFNYFQEIKRRSSMERSFSKTKEDAKIEQDIYNSSYEINNKIMKLEKIEKSIAFLKNDFKLQDNFEEFIQNNQNTESFAYLRSQKMLFPMQIPQKMQRNLDYYLKELNIEKVVPTKRVEEEFDNLRLNVVKLISLKKHLEKKKNERKLLESSVQSTKFSIPKTNNNIISSTNHIPNEHLINNNYSAPMVDVKLAANSKDKKRKKNEGLPFSSTQSVTSLNISNTQVIVNNSDNISRKSYKTNVSSTSIQSNNQKRKTNTINQKDEQDSSARKRKKTNKKDD